MKRTEVVREAADALHTAEAAVETAIIEAQAALDRLSLARKELGLTGTMGDAMIARVTETVATLHDGRAKLIEGHQEAYAVLQAINIRGVAIWPTVFAPRDHANAA